MSDSSDDDVPIAQRQTLKQSAAAEPASAHAAPARVKSGGDESTDDDVPLAARTSQRPANKGEQNVLSCAHDRESERTALFR